MTELEEQLAERARTGGEPGLAAEGEHGEPWRLVYDGFDPAQERLREALCTLGNGYQAVRGAAPEAQAGPHHYPGTYAAGVFNRLTTEVGGRSVENESIVNLPNWLPLGFRVDGGEWFDLDTVELLEYEQELDLRRGLLSRRLRFADPEGRRTRLVQRRFVSMDHAHLAGLETTIQPEDWGGRLEVSSGLDGGVANTGVARYRDLASRHLVDVETAAAGEDTIELSARTSQSGIRIAEAARTRLCRAGEPVAAEARVERDGERIAQLFSLELEPGDAVTVEKIVALYTSRDPAISEPSLEARKAVVRAPGFTELLEAHVGRWADLWKRCGLELADDERTLLVLRLHVFHLLQTVSERSIGLDVGVPARGLHGEAYRGHVFWDELFVFPYLNLRLPELTRSLLGYRTLRLDEARAAAREAGYEGAMYPWQSGSDGREETQTLHLNPRSGRWLPDHSRLQRHVGSAIAYNLWHYYQATGDIEFLASSGAEMLLEIARFWAGVAVYEHVRDRYEIRGIVGPDEYHDAYPDADEPGLDNNAYTNVMAVWVLRRALELLELLPSERREALERQLAIAPAEIDRWEDISRRMFVPFHEDGVISQFEGYEDLEELDWDGYRERYGNIQRLDRILEAEGDTPNRYKASKQADVLMLFYLLSADELADLFARLGYSFDTETIPRTIDYYISRTSHGSTLSRIVHSWVLARSDRERSWTLFREALEADVADVQGGTTEEGIHLGAMAGTVDLLQRGYTGIEARGDVLHFNPQLPQGLDSLSFPIRYRRYWGIEVTIVDSRLRVRTPATADTPPITIAYAGETVELHPGETAEIDLAQERVDAAPPKLR